MNKQGIIAGLIVGAVVIYVFSVSDTQPVDNQAETQQTNTSGYNSNFSFQNSKGEGTVITTASGLKYEIMTMGNGEKPNATDKVEVHYHGTLEDGTVFDSSVDRGQTITFPLNRVIKGWTEGLQLMPIGSKFKF